MNALTNYYNDIPANTGQQVATAFAFSAAIDVIAYDRPVDKACAHAALFASATLVHGVVSPIFKRSFSNFYASMLGKLRNNNINLKDRLALCSLEFLRTGVSVLTATVAASYLGRSRMLAPIKLAMAINAIHMVLKPARCLPYFTSIIAI